MIMLESIANDETYRNLREKALNVLHRKIGARVKVQPVMALAGTPR